MVKVESFRIEMTNLGGEKAESPTVKKKLDENYKIIITKTIQVNDTNLSRSIAC